VVKAGPIHLAGFPGWVVWLFIHVAFLTGFRNRISALLTWWLAFVRDIRRERAFTTRQVGQVSNIYDALPDTPPESGRAPKPREAGARASKSARS